MRREDRQALLVGRHDHDHKPGRLLGAVLARGRRASSRSGGGRRRSGAARPAAPRSARRRTRGRAARAAPSTPPSLDGEVGLAEAVDLDRPVPEQEDRLELRARRASAGEAAPPSARRACARAAGRRGSSYGSARSAATKPSRVRSTPSGPTYAGESHQYAGSSSSTSTPASRQSARSRAACSSDVGERQMDDVVRAPARGTRRAARREITS